MPSPTPTPVPDASFLADYARQGAFTDCYQTTVAAQVSLADFIEAFYTTRLFKVERWLLGKALNLPDSDAQATALARTETTRFSAWRVEQRSEVQILMDAGQTRSWLSVAPVPGSVASTTLLFGSAVVPQRAGGRFGVLFHLLLGFHRWYSKALLAAAAQRVILR